MRNISNKFVGYQNKHFMFNNILFFRKSCRLSDKVEKYCTDRQTDRQATDDSIIWRMHFLYCITMATDTHSEYVIFIAFP